MRAWALGGKWVGGGGKGGREEGGIVQTVHTRHQVLTYSYGSIHGPVRSECFVPPGSLFTTRWPTVCTP